MNKIRDEISLRSAQSRSSYLKLIHQWKDIELNAKELSEEGLVFQNTYFDQNFVCDYSDKNTDQIIFSDHDRFEKVILLWGTRYVEELAFKDLLENLNEHETHNCFFFTYVLNK